MSQLKKFKEENMENIEFLIENGVLKAITGQPIPRYFA